MRDRDLERAADSAGLLTQWRDAFGKPQRVSPDTLRALLDTMHADGAETSVPPLVVTDASAPSIALPLRGMPTRARLYLEQGGRRDCTLRRRGDRLQLGTALPPGYHTLEFGKTRIVLAAAPRRGFSVADAVGNDEKRWGIAAQLYSLRRKGDLGVGDFTALAQFAESAAQHGAAAVALSPVHAMFYADARRFSPYSPSNRAFLNVLYSDPQKLLRDSHASADGNSVLIDWPVSAAAHRTLSEAAFARTAAGELPGAGDFAEFRRSGGDALARHALFEALDEDGGRKPDVNSPAAQRFRDAHGERIGLHTFLQWRAARDLADANAAARRLPIGFIADLAVGVDPNGSECWSQPEAMLIGATIGAPPDLLNAIGQSWGLTTFSPAALQRDGFAAFLSVLRAAMRYAGGVRLDHVMSLMRLWLVPDGARPVDGAYLRYPFDDLVRLVALESWRHRCIVIGEDLGTVPDDCRTRLADTGILGMDVLPFMGNAAGILPPKRWRANAVAMTSTHDLAPMGGWWAGRDLDWRRRLQLFGDRDENSERAERVRSKAQLASALSRNGARVSARASGERIVDAAIDYVAASASPLAILPMEDLLGAIEAPNLPGTIDEHPNWRRRYRAPASKLLDTPRVARRLRRLRQRRKHS
jgi:4-alpha-glucanotransferase